MANENGANDNENATEQTNKPIVRLTGMITLFTFALALIAGLQLLTFIQSERAFVAPASTNFATELVPGIAHLPMYLDIQNSGRSTAFVEELSVAITHNLPSKPQYFDTINIAFPPIVAGGVSRRSSKFVTGWNQETIDEITSGALNFYIYGVIKYSDGYTIFGPTITGFCFVYIPGAGSNSTAFETCKEPAYTYSK